MSRWVDQFQTHGFQSSWGDLKNSLDASKVDDETVITSVKELARLKKVIAFLDEMINGIDPEFVPMSTWDSFHGQAAPCYSQINAYNENRNIDHIVQANAHADNLLTYVRPYMVVEGKIGKALQRSIKAYAATVDEYGQNFKDKADLLIAEIEDNKVNSEERFGFIEKIATQVDEFNSELFSDEDSLGVQSNIRALSEELDEKYQEINSYYDEILVGSDEQPSTKKEVSLARSLIIEKQQEIQEILGSVIVEVSELKKFHVDMFGKPDEDEILVGGLSGDLDILRKSLEDFDEEQKIKYAALNTEIESLIPGATSAGLASAYRALRRSFAAPLKTYARLFYISVALLFTISFVSVIKSIGFWHIELVEISDPVSLFNNLVFKLPFLLPVLWLAIFASKRRSEAQRLQQEYAHKEALAKSYQSFKKQIDDLGEKDSELLKQLLETAIKAVAFNASSTLDKKHGDNMPTQSLLEKIAEKLN